MKNSLAMGLLAFVVPSLFLIGCYTQFAAQDEPAWDRPSRDQDRTAYADTTNTDEGEDYDGARRRFYYGYYPAVSIGFGFGPWYLDPWYYDPWYYGAWPGPYYYGGWYRPWYHTGYWSAPVWGGGGWYAPHYGYHGKTRTFGNSRMIGTGRGVIGNTRINDGSGTGIYQGGNTRSVRSGTGTRYGTVGRSPGGQSTVTPKGSTGRRNVERSVAPRVREYRAPQAAPRREGSARTPSYSPPPSRPSAPSYGGGGGHSSGGSRSGGGGHSGGGGGGGSRGGNRR